MKSTRPRLLAYLTMHGPLSCKQIGDALGIGPVWACRQLMALHDDGLIEDAGSGYVNGGNGARIRTRLWRAAGAAHVIKPADDNARLVEQALDARTGLERAWMGSTAA